MSEMVKCKECRWEGKDTCPKREILQRVGDFEFMVPDLTTPLPELISSAFVRSHIKYIHGCATGQAKEKEGTEKTPEDVTLEERVYRLEKWVGRHLDKDENKPAPISQEKEGPDISSSRFIREEYELIEKYLPYRDVETLGRIHGEGLRDIIKIWEKFVVTRCDEYLRRLKQPAPLEIPDEVVGRIKDAVLKDIPFPYRGCDVERLQKMRNDNIKQILLDWIATVKKGV